MGCLEVVLGRGRGYRGGMMVFRNFEDLSMIVFLALEVGFNVREKFLDRRLSAMFNVNRK